MVPSFVRDHTWRILGVLLLLVLLTVGIAFVRQTPSEAYPGMPKDQRDYWSWVSSINREPETAVESGLELLAGHEHLPLLYLRLADVCLNADAADRCRTALEQMQAPDAVTGLYREAALTRLLSADLTDQEISLWKTIAASPHLTPALARVIVDRAQRDREIGWLADLESSWSEQLRADSSAAGAAFGLGYAAVLRRDWDTGEQYLEHVTKLVPEDPEAYQEFGRIYYFTGQYEPFVEVLERGIASARAQFDLEKELALSGNLALSHLQWKEDLERAGALFEEALEQSRYIGNNTSEAFNLSRLANVRARQHRYSEALELLDLAYGRYLEHLPQRASEIQVLRGRVLTEMFHFSEASTELEEAVRSAEASEDAVALVDGLIALVHLKFRLGQYGEASSIGLRGLEVASKYRMADFAIAARLALGNVERELGNFAAAKQHWQEALTVAEQTGNVTRRRELLHRLGHLSLGMQDTNGARSYFQQMLSAVQSNTLDRANAYLGLGSTYDQFENYAEALRYHDLALKEIHDGGEGSLKAKALTVKASALFKLGRADEAIEILEQARPLTAGDRIREYSIDIILGHIHLEQGQFEKALAHLAEAERREHELQWSSMHWHLSFPKAVAYWRLGRVVEAEQAFLDAISVIETLRGSFNKAEDRSVFVRNKVDVYKSYSAFLEEQGRIKEAFHYLERARSRTLVDLLYTTQQGRPLDMEDPADQAIELGRRFRAIDDELESESFAFDPPERTLYRGNRAAYLRRERMRADSLYQQVHAQISLYGQSRVFSFNPIQADSVQALLGDGEALVSFSLRRPFAEQETKEASTAYLVLRDTIIVRHLSIGGTLAETVRFFRDRISNSIRQPDRSLETVARRLYDELMEPVISVMPSNVRHLHIVPEGVLHYVPFAALQAGDGAYLIEKYDISIAPSASILKLSRERNPRLWSYMLLLADPDGRLPGARHEVLTIAADSPSRRHVLVGQEATQETFENVARNYDIIHFATHGNFVSRAPWLSHLELSGGVLSVEEIGRLRIDAYLVTLSACETALSGGLVSDVPNGDEWVGLNQAFLAAGTPTVLASLWSIDDRVSSSFMAGFYSRLGTAGKANALAEMQRSFIRRTETNHPFYWAAFTVIGDPL